jgi:hypothetical protein
MESKLGELTSWMKEKKDYVETWAKSTARNSRDTKTGEELSWEERKKRMLADKEKYGRSG